MTMSRPFAYTIHDTLHEIYDKYGLHDKVEYVTDPDEKKSEELHFIFNKHGIHRVTFSYQTIYLADDWLLFVIGPESCRHHTAISFFFPLPDDLNQYLRMYVIQWFIDHLQDCGDDDHGLTPSHCDED